MKRQQQDFKKIYTPDRCDPLIQAASTGQLCMKGLRRYDYPGVDLPDFVLPGVCSMGYWDAKTAQDWGWTGTGMKEWSLHF
ncbi:hypothetical protein [Parapedobacter soli]|uniref:hypothetical protein n=1 Tax=Parapedobacter soli TaxID=416955 RepID=UPI0021C6CD9F|nr:hypothetical protein [Parapedobacter soli]